MILECVLVSLNCLWKENSTQKKKAKKKERGGEGGEGCVRANRMQITTHHTYDDNGFQTMMRPDESADATNLGLKHSLVFDVVELSAIRVRFAFVFVLICVVSCCCFVLFCFVLFCFVLISKTLSH
jgi:hypothetical protein